MGKMTLKVMVYIWHLDSIKSIAIDFLDTVDILKMKALGYSEPEEAAFYVVEIVYLKEHSRCRLLSDQSRLIEAILHDETISLSKAILVIRDFRHAINDSIYSAAINGNGSTATSLNPAAPVAFTPNQVNNGIVSFRGNQGKVTECEPWTSHPNGCTEWIYSPYHVTNYSTYNHVAHYKLELFEDRLFQAICDASSKQGQLQRSLRSNGAWRDGYYCYYKRALWCHNTTSTNTLGVVNNVSSAQTMESNANGFAVNYTAGKTEESVYLAVTDENPKKCRSWLSAINTGSTDDDISQSILNADITIAAMELTASERSVQRTCKLGDINTAIEITYVRRLFQQYLAGKNIGNLLPAFEVMEDYQRSFEKNREKALNRATVIYKAFLSSSASDPIDMHSEPIGPVVELLVDGKCEANMFHGVLTEVAKKLSHQYYHGFLPEYRDQLILIDSLYPSFHDSSASRSKGDASMQSPTGTPSKSSNSSQTPTTSPTNPTSSASSTSTSSGSRFWSRPLFNKFMPRRNTATSDTSTTSSTSYTTDNDMNSQFDSSSVPTSPTTKQTNETNFLFSSWSTSNVLISRAGESWWQNYSRDKSRHLMPTNGLKNSAEHGISNQFAPDIPSQVLSWAFQQSFQHIWDFSDSNEQKESEDSDEGNVNENETSNDNIDDTNKSTNERDEDEEEEDDTMDAMAMQDISEMFGMGCIRKIGHVYAKYFRSKTKAPVTFTLGSGEDTIGGTHTTGGLALNGTLGSTSNTNNINGNNGNANNTATFFEEVSRERWPSEDFMTGAGSSVSDGRPVTAMLTLMPSQRLGRLLLLENDKIIVRIHLKNCVKIVFAHDDPTSIVIEDEIGAKWHLQPEGSDDIDCFEQARSWHHCITACMPGHITRESVEAMGYFLKRGKINTSLRKRWFMLISDTRNHWRLRYYKDENNLIYKGEINLSIVDTVECSQSGESSESTASHNNTANHNNNSNNNNSGNSQGVLSSSNSGTNNAQNTTTTASSSASRFRILRGSQSRTIKLISKHRTWELVTDSQSQADYWFPLLRQVVSISGTVAFNENDFYDEEGDDEGEDYD